METVTILGLIAGIFTSFGFFPQVHKCWRTKSTKDISLPAFSILTLGIILWLIYGILLGDLPLIAANVVALVFSVSILLLKLKYK